MITYRDVSYCDTDHNKCKNKECQRHLDTEEEHFKLKHNVHKLPISLADFSEACTGFKK